MDGQAQARNRLSRATARQANRGRALEDLLAIQHAQYGAQRVAWIRHFPTPVAIERRAGRIVGARPTGLAVADYLGWLYCSGRALAVEAKEEAGWRFTLARIQPQQRECLDACADAGGLAALVLWWGPADERWAVPWRAVRERIARGERSVPWEPDQPWSVRRGRGPCDYLASLGV